MGDTTSPATSPLINDLLTRGHEFSFCQVMRIARNHFGAGGAGELPGIPWQDRVRIRPALSLAFPAADVARVDRAGKDGVDLLITTTFLGLYGTSSPLPNHYTEQLLDEAADGFSACRDLLDIFHQRLYHLHFQCCMKYRLNLSLDEEEDSVGMERLCCLIGLNTNQLRDRVPEARELLRYAGLFSQPRSALGLQTLLRDAMGVSKLEVEQCVPRQAPIPEDQQTRLASASNRLGVDTVLGSEMPDLMGKFRIHIGPLSKNEFDSFLPGSSKYVKLANFVRLYISDHLDFDLRLTLAAGEAGPICLGAPNDHQLGCNSWCFSGGTLGEKSALFPLAQAATMPPVPVAAEFDPEPETCSPLTLMEYYQQELARIHELAAKYAEAHPKLSFLASGQQDEAGMEELFEKVAFVNTHLQRKLDDDFPEFINAVTHAVTPNYLRPLPATTIIVFEPKPNCTATKVIPVGTEIISIPVEGTCCCFTTSYPVEIHPLTITDASFAQPPGKVPVITIRLRLAAMKLAEWNPKSLRFFLAGEKSSATNLNLVLMRYVKAIKIAAAESGQPVTLDADHLKAAGFEDSELLFPSTSSVAIHHQLMQEYFIQPAKFLFVDLHGWEKWRSRGEGSEFEIRFELETHPFPLHQVNKNDFALFATPAVNLYRQKARPFIYDDIRQKQLAIPAEDTSDHAVIYSIERVVGYLDQTSEKMEFRPSVGNPLFSQVPTYDVSHTTSDSHEGVDTYISIENPSKKNLSKMRVEIDLLCTNGPLSDKLRTGDICQSTDSTPNFAVFRNCKEVSPSGDVRVGNNILWKRYSSLIAPLAQLTVKSLRAMLEQCAQAYFRSHATAKVDAERIQTLSQLHIQPVNRLIDRTILPGWEISIKLDPVSPASPGELYMFGALLDQFLRGFVSETCFTRTIVQDVQSGTEYQWPAKMGRRHSL